MPTSGPPPGGPPRGRLRGRLAQLPERRPERERSRLLSGQVERATEDEGDCCDRSVHHQILRYVATLDSISRLEVRGFNRRPPRHLNWQSSRGNGSLLCGTAAGGPQRLRQFAIPSLPLVRQLFGLRRVGGREIPRLTDIGREVVKLRGREIAQDRRVGGRAPLVSSRASSRLCESPSFRRAAIKRSCTDP